MKTMIAIIALVAIIMGTASATMPTVLVGAIKEYSQNAEGPNEISVTPESVMLTARLPIAKAEVPLLDRDVMVYEMYNITANMADAIGMTAATIGVDHGHPQITIHVVDKDGVMMMYYTAQDPLGMTPAALSDDIAANLVIT